MIIFKWLIGLSASGLLGFTMIVAVRYWMGWNFILRTGGKQRHLLPLHVWVVAISYDLFLLGAVAQVYSDRMHWWCPVIYLPAIAMGMAAMAVLVRIGRLSDLSWAEETRDK